MDPNVSEQNTPRITAVKIHDATADRFEREYANSASYTDTAFLYGRHLVDISWRRIVDGLPSGARVLDIGCGVGVYMAQLLSRGIDAIGLEPSSEMRQRASARLGSEHLIDGSVFALPFANQSLDFVYAIEVLRYFNGEDIRRAHAEIFRVLKPGGVYFGTYVNLLAADLFLPLVAARRVRERLFGIPVNCHTAFETPKGLERKLLDAGFSSVEEHGALFGPLRIAYRFLPRGIASTLARQVEPMEPWLSDLPSTRPFAGHLICEARR